METWESHHRKNEKQIPMQSDIDSSGASFTEGPLFRIFDCIPDWGLSDVETKVMVLVDILGGVNLPSTMKWFCKFGEVEVPGQLLTPNTLRCYAPPHGPGRIPIYVTYGNGRPCSNVYEFEYVHKQCTQLSDEKKFQQRILHMMKFEARSMQTELEVTLWKTLRIARYFRYKFNRNDPRASTFERDLKVEFFEWLIISVHKEDNKLNVLDEEGQGIIHLLSALGYQWAIRPLVAAGANPNFRDAHGWTALHWAASYGREETVVTLIRLGAAPDALDDPTSEFPEGRTASDLASIKGHESIARYLAEHIRLDSIHI
ncbi:Calmodulin-binding transcription activator 3 [Acorus calamus]|uniref:Calmodulin-binding transcription activator 3 n=1 Tax=Acorus calamus TaxID=4465 RepID=A0AAV9CXT9_ACOCL|nr:Calmodulin-binding transcription activator 3 [Acorus calamus]